MASLLLRALWRPQLLYKQLSRISPPRPLTPADKRTARPTILEQIQQRRWAANQSMDLPKGRAQPSMRLQAGDESELYLRDIGLLPDTYVPVSRKNRPSLFKDPKDRFRLFKKILTYKFKNLVNIAMYRYYNKVPIEYYQPRRIALRLYNEMYKAFAEGNTPLLRQICCDGLYDSFKSQIAARGRNKMLWSMVLLEDRPKIVSNNAITIPDMKMGFRQAVVRIKSQQKVYRYDSRGNQLPGSGQTVPVVEYLVLQKRRTKNEDGEWMVWGTTEETTLGMLEYREATSPFNRRS